MQSCQDLGRMEAVRIKISLGGELHGTEKGEEQTQEGRNEGLLQFAVRLCRKHNLVKDRVTVLSPSDFLQILQLCQAQEQKKMGKDFHVENGAVFTLPKHVCIHKLKLAISETRDILCRLIQTTKDGTEKSENDQVPSHQEEDVLNQTPSRSCLLAGGENQPESDTEEPSVNILKEYQDFLAGSNHIDLVDILRVFVCEILSPQSEIYADLNSVKIQKVDSPQDPLQDIILDILTSRNTVEVTAPSVDQIHRCLAICARDLSAFKSFIFQPEGQVMGNADTEESAVTTGTTLEETFTKELVLELFHSYLHLLVNTRSELAFAHVFNAPDRDLTHQAFTSLKHEAQKKNMSLYQTAMSLIMKLRLGGEGYAPDHNNKLLQYVKGLGLLSDLMNKLQELLEDTQCVRTSVHRVVGVIKKNLIACKSQRYKRDIVESVAQQIRTDLELVLTELQTNNTLISPDKPASQGGSLTSRRPRRVLLHYLDRYAACLWETSQTSHHTWLHDVPFGPHTPSRFPCVMSQFSQYIGLQTIRSKYPVGYLIKNLSLSIQSTNLMPSDVDQPLFNRCYEKLKDTVIVIPSKTIVHPAESKLLPAEAVVNEKENMNPIVSPARKKVKRTKINNTNKEVKAPTSAGPVSMTGLKDSVQENKDAEKTSCQPASVRKAAPKPEKKCRRRLLAPIKGQQSITNFFRS